MAIEGIFYVHAKVADLGRAKQFYGETLGWKLHTDERHVAGFWFGSGYLVAGLDTGATGRPAPPAPPARAEGMYVAVRVSDIEAEHARLSRHGVQVSPVQRQPWGARNFQFTDPDGYLWLYGEPV